MKIDASSVLLVGHRGTGKTKLLQTIGSIFPNYLTIDLDAEIEKATGLSIFDIFSEKGEAGFRSIENHVFDEVFGPEKIIAVGAGFTGEIPKAAFCIWVRRNSDSNGRIFLDRPSLNSEIGDLEEYNERFDERQLKYGTQSHLILTLREGENDFALELLLSGRFKHSGIFTVEPRHLESLSSIQQFRPEYVEVRDDLLKESEIEFVANFFGDERILYSHRKNLVTDWQRFALRDWPIEKGICPKPEKWEILSCHDPSLLEIFCEHEGFHKFSKMAIPVDSFDALKKWDDWSLQKDCRSFLPISQTGRWKWYRQLNKNIFFLNFFSDGVGEIKDQPSVLEWLAVPRDFAHFAAILGQPVKNSRTPVEQGEFFLKENIPVVAVSVTEQEWSSAFDFLKSKGLLAAAVTSPLKKLAFSVVDEFKGDGSNESANTLYLGDVVAGTNTDFEALKQWTGELENIAVWGGGGLLPTLRSVFKNADFYSARTGALRDESNASLDLGDRHYSYLIWASGNRCEIVPGFSFEQVWDLSYSEDSMARSLAKKIKCQYHSGTVMFSYQALAQRRFWSPFWS